MTLPELRLAAWRATKDTLHLYAQILGKIRLATTAPRKPLAERPAVVESSTYQSQRVPPGMHQK